MEHEGQALRGLQRLQHDEQRGADRVGADAERAALALAEAVTRVADRSEPVPDEIWDAAAEHFDETQLGALVLDIATVDLWTRLNVATRQIVGEQSW